MVRFLFMFLKALSGINSKNGSISESKFVKSKNVEFWYFTSRILLRIFIKAL
jgi:hypothetical protein